MILIYPWLGENELGYNFLSDRLHHYQAGLVLILVGVVLHRKLRQRFVTYLAVCIALVLEEYVVIVDDFGLRPPYRYLSALDNLIVYSLAVVAALVTYGVRKMGK